MTIRIYIAIDQNGRIWMDGYDKLAVREETLRLMDMAASLNHPVMKGVKELTFDVFGIDVSGEPHLN